MTVRKAVTRKIQRKDNEIYMKKNFILTKSADTANELKKAGYILVNQSDGHWLFINDSKLTFSFNEDVTFTNKLYF